MKSIFLEHIAHKGLLIIIVAFCSCSPVDEVIPKPVIVVSLLPSPNFNECISGHVEGVDTKLYKLAIYANVNGGWYNIPDRYNPLTNIGEESGWICKTDIDPNVTVSELAIYLLPNGYSPPILDGENIIPLKMSLVSASKKAILME